MHSKGQAPPEGARPSEWQATGALIVDTLVVCHCVKVEVATWAPRPIDFPYCLGTQQTQPFMYLRNTSNVLAPRSGQPLDRAAQNDPHRAKPPLRHHLGYWLHYEGSTKYIYVHLIAFLPDHLCKTYLAPKGCSSLLL
jgi:hypothetical protein